MDPSQESVGEGNCWADQEEFERFVELLEQLSPLRRHAFVLFRIEELPFAEIASLLGISPCSVERHVTKAMQHIMCRLEMIEPCKLCVKAVQWLVRVHSGNCAGAERAVFERWLHQDDGHRRAYAQAEARWHWMETFKPRCFRARAEALHYRPVRHPLRRAAMAAAISLLLASLGITALGPDGWYGVSATYVSARGVHETVALVDGSTLELNTNTVAKVHINHWCRSVELVRGEAYFHVVHEPDRPFVVKAGAGMIRDLGTAFEVYMQPERVMVAVDDGSVQVEARGSRVLVAGQRLAFGRRGEFIPLEEKVVSALTAWREGRIVFRERTLDEVLEEVGRYHEPRIRLSDPAQGALRVSGTFSTDDLNGILKYITSVLPVRINHAGDSEIVLEPAYPSRR